MSLVDMGPMLRRARAEGYAVAAFNVLDYNCALAVARAAETLHAPVIMQVSVKTIRFWGAEEVASWVKQAARDRPVPIALHLDHCQDVVFVETCLRAGWTSVMIDASQLPFEQNLAVTREVLSLASPYGAGVEAELGQIGGVEDDLSVDEADAHLVDPEKAIEFCRDLPLAAFAPAIGTAHGYYKGEPKVDFARLEAVARGTSTPLALHGGTGLPGPIIQRCIRAGCAKINISTQLKHVYIDSFVSAHNDQPDYEALRILRRQSDDLTAMAAEKIRQFGGAGRGVLSEAGMASAG